MSKTQVQDSKADPGDRIDPVDHWFAQESDQAQLERDADIDLLLAEQRMPSGWWILPALVMALPIWGFLISMLIRA